MLVDCCPVVGFSSTFWRLGSRQQRKEHFFSEHVESGHAAQSVRGALVSSGVAYFLYEVFAAKFLEVIGGLAWAVRYLTGLEYAGDLCGEFRGRKAFRLGGKDNGRSHDGAHPGIVNINAGHAGSADLSGQRQLFPDASVNEGGVHTVQDTDEALEHCAQCRYNLRETVYDFATTEAFGVVDNTFDSEDSLAFAVYLQGDWSKVDLEHREIPDRPLDQDLKSLVCHSAFARTFLASQNGPDGSYVKRGACAVDEGLKDLVHLAPSPEEEVAAVFPLIDRIGIVKSTTVAVFGGQGKTQACRINPTLADLGQAPYSAWGAHGICDTGKGCGVGNLSETVALLGKSDPFAGRLTCHILMAIEHDLCAEGRMRAQLDRDMSPLWVDDVERILVDVRVRFDRLDVRLSITATAYFSNGRRGSSHQYAEYSFEVRVGWEQVFGKLMFALAALAVNQGNTLFLRVLVDPATKASREPHEMGIIQFVVIAQEPAPPRTESSARPGQSEIGVQDDTIYTVVHVIKQITVGFAEFICHGRHVSPPNSHKTMGRGDHISTIRAHPRNTYAAAKNTMARAAPKAPLLPGEVPDEA